MKTTWVPVVAVSAVLLVATATAASVTAPASAQSGSRICGAVWTSLVPSPVDGWPARMERRIVTRYIEVRATDNVTCDYAMPRIESNPIPETYPDWDNGVWDFKKLKLGTTCEWFTETYLRDSVRNPDGSVVTDICLQMDRTDNLIEFAADGVTQKRLSFFE